MENYNNYFNSKNQQQLSLVKQREVQKNNQIMSNKSNTATPIPSSKEFQFLNNNRMVNSNKQPLKTEPMLIKKNDAISNPTSPTTNKNNYSNIPNILQQQQQQQQKIKQIQSSPIQSTNQKKFSTPSPSSLINGSTHVSEQPQQQNSIPMKPSSLSTINSSPFNKSYYLYGANTDTVSNGGSNMSSMNDQMNISYQESEMENENTLQSTSQKQFENEEELLVENGFPIFDPTIKSEMEFTQNCFYGLCKIVGTIEDQYQQKLSTIESLNQKVLQLEDDLKQSQQNIQSLYNEKYIIQMKFNELETQCSKFNFEYKTMKLNADANQEKIKEVEGRKSYIEDQIQKFEKHILEVNENKDSLRKMNETLNFELEQLSTALKQKESRERHLIDEIKSSNLAHENEVKELQDLNLAKRIEITNLESNIKTSLKQKSELELKFKDKTLEIESLTKKLTDSTNKIDSITNDLQSQRLAVIDKNNAIDVLQKSEMDLKVHLQESLLKYQHLDQDYQDLAQRNKQQAEILNTTQRDKDHYQQELEKQQSQYKELYSKSELEYTKISNSLEQCQKQNADIQSQLQSVQSDYSQACEKNHQSEIEVQNILTQLSETESKILSLSSKLEKFESDIESLTKDRDLKSKTIQEKNKLYENLESKYSHIKNEFSKISSSCHEQIQAYELKIGNFEKIIQEKDSSIQELTVFKDIHENNQLMITNNANNMNNNANNTNIINGNNINPNDNMLLLESFPNNNTNDLTILNTPPIPNYPSLPSVNQPVTPTTKGRKKVAENKSK
ncbi:centrosomal protein [Tieghemostelium lacteum]|uniref:Centrosomal protein n=1 Tax=Tieghemostelium lacteum TaxID=361077 RepID=A0A151ZBC0_TIELA|nr:centrosomal protein [Tieghemostelium lacteum]|eukprot:KYQ91239.1 centrosomal protein [Tieghemostelium lacteum]